MESKLFCKAQEGNVSCFNLLSILKRIKIILKQHHAHSIAGTNVIFKETANVFLVNNIKSLSQAH